MLRITNLVTVGLKSSVWLFDKVMKPLNQRVTYAYLEGYLRWLLGFPLLAGQILLYLAIAWGILGAELGIPDLFWHEQILEQFWVGMGVCWLFGIVVFLNYLLHEPRQLPGKPKDLEVDRQFWLTLFPSRDPGIRLVGRWVAYWLLFLLAVLFLGKFLAPYVAESWLDRKDISDFYPPHYGWPLALGYLSGFLMAFTISYLDHFTGFRDTIAEQDWIRRPFADEENQPPRNPFDVVTLQRLHAMAAFIFLISSLILLGIVVAATANRVLSPAVVLSIVLIVLDGAAGFVAYRIRSHRTLALLLVLYLLFINSQSYNQNKMTFPHLEEPGAISYSGDPPFSLEQSDYHSVVKDRYPPDGLINFAAQLSAYKSQAGPKKKLIVVAVSGGGIRAAVWTAVVLERLEQELGAEEFRRRVRLFAGASGGMVAAASYVGDFSNGPLPSESPRLSEVLAEESLSPVIQTMLLRDFGWNALIPKRFATDRGRTLEETWDANFQKLNYRGTGASPLAKPIRSLHEPEKNGAVPSLIFSPLMVEDARRLLISNLDLEEHTRPRAQRLNHAGEPLGLPAMEFYRLFPAASRFRLGTAARMSASFPVVSPAVGLPMTPVRRLVDAGYYDNYGVNLLAEWLLNHQPKLSQELDGVVLIQIRAFPVEYPGNHVVEVPRTVTDKLIAAVNAPAEALLTAQSWSAYHRNNNLVVELSRRFNTPEKPDFFTTVTFGFNGRAALNWYLPQTDKAAIWGGFQDEHQQAAQRLKAWLAK